MYTEYAVSRTCMYIHTVLHCTYIHLSVLVLHVHVRTHIHAHATCTQPRRSQPQQLYATKDKPVSSEMFVALVTERLLAVEKDRKAMEQRVRDDARRMGKEFKEIMVSLELLNGWGG